MAASGLRQGVNIFLVAATAVACVVAARHYQAGPRQAKDIRDNLETAEGLDSLTDLDVRIDGRSRTAVISGKVDTKPEQVRAAEAALKTRGLLTVFNQITVDAIIEELLIDLRKLAEDDPTIGDFNYRIHPDNHTVTIEGWVHEDQPHRIDQLASLARNVPGVRKLQNNMRVGRPDEDISKIQELIFDILRLGNNYFDYNKSTIRPESRESLSKIAGVLKEYPKVRVQVEGHTDSIASEQYNQALSERRANAVRDTLIEFGVAPERIEAVGYGESRPVAPNDTPEGRADNRRTEFTILKPGALAPDMDAE